MLNLVIFLLGGLGYRLRGGGAEEIDGLGTQQRRFFYWAIPVGVVITFVTQSAWIGLLSVPLLWLGVVPNYFGGMFDLTNPANRKPRNYFWLTVRGMFVCVPLATGLIALRAYGYEGGTALGGVIASVMFVPAYLLGVPLSRWIKVPGMEFCNLWGELILGGCILLGIVASI